MHDADPPLLMAVAGSARQLFLLLRCITFSAARAHVTIDKDGLKFAVSEGSSMEASTSLDKSLFTTYTFHAPAPQRADISDSDDPDDDAPSGPTFQVSLPALLETLQIFGLTDPNTSRPPWARDNAFATSTAFFNNVLGVHNTCRITYHREGAPLSLVLSEASIRTTCDLSTYEPQYTEEIPFDRRSVVMKVIMPGSCLYDALSELSSTSPDKLTMYVKTLDGKPFFALSATGTLGSARVEFNNHSQPSRHTAGGVPDQQTSLLETFLLSHPSDLLRQSYKFALIQKAARAMSLGRKVSIRMDSQGVLSLQFMVDMDAAAAAGAARAGGGTEAVSNTDKLSFINFVIVPLIEDDDNDDDEAHAAAEADINDETILVNGNGSESDQDDDMLT
ncbi:checkpoint clamp complex protein Rad1 [Pleosporales sp. CAS-2024a]